MNTKFQKGALVKAAANNEVITHILDDPRVRMALGGLIGGTIGAGSEYLSNYDDPHSEKERGERMLLKGLEHGLYGAGLGGVSSMFGPNIGKNINV